MPTLLRAHVFQPTSSTTAPAACGAFGKKSFCWTILRSKGKEQVCDRRIT